MLKIERFFCFLLFYILLMPGNQQKKFLLCLHDVGVDNFSKVAPIIESVNRITGKPFALAVVPFTGNAPDSKKEAFQNQLLQWQNAGYELLLHGYTHRTDLKASRSYSGYFASLLTHNEAEFAGLTEEASLEEVTCAFEAWKLLSLPDPVCFVPPTWYANKALPQQVLARCPLYEGRTQLQKKKNDAIAIIRSPALSFAGIPQWMLGLAFAYSKVSLALPTGIPRLALHPVDFETCEKRIFEILDFALARRSLVQYSEL